MRTSSMVLIAMAGLSTGCLKQVQQLNSWLETAQDPMSGQYARDYKEALATIEEMKGRTPTQDADAYEALWDEFDTVYHRCEYGRTDDAKATCHRQLQEAWYPQFVASTEQRIEAGDGLVAHWGARELGLKIRRAYWVLDTEDPIALSQRAAAVRAENAQSDLYSKYQRYAKSHEWGCVASEAALPRSPGQRIDVAYHTTASERLYVRCFLPTDLATIVQNKEVSDFGASLDVSDWTEGAEEAVYHQSINLREHLEKDWVDFVVDMDHEKHRDSFGTAQIEFYLYWIAGYQDTWNDSRGAFVRTPIGENHTERVTLSYDR